VSVLGSVNKLLLDILKPAMSPVTVTSRRASQYALPLVTARRYGGAWLDPRGLDQPNVEIHGFAATDAAAEQLVLDAAQALVTAWRKQTAYEHGHVQWVNELAGAVVVPDPNAPQGESHAVATYQLRVRPAAGA
jgi:hypothetical protein